MGRVAYYVVVIKVVIEVIAEVVAEVAAELVAELRVWVKIRQPEELKAEELKMFDSLRLSVVLLVEVSTEVLTEVLAELAAELVRTELVRTELEAWFEIRQPKELKVFDSLRLSVVLLMAIRY